MPDWYAALNYFLWLAYFNNALDITSYFVLHSPNLQRQSRRFVYDSEQEISPSGMIISSKGRLALKARDELSLIFSIIMNPLSEIIYASTVKNAGILEGENELLHTIKTKITGIDVLLASPESADMGRALLKLLKNQIILFEKANRLVLKKLSPSQIVKFHNHQFKESWGFISGLTEKKWTILSKETSFDDRALFHINLWLYDLMLFEVLWNLKQHADESQDIQMWIEVSGSKDQLVLIVENYADDSSFYNMSGGAIVKTRGVPRLSGLGLIEKVQRYLGCHQLWWFEILDEKNKKIRFYYPFANKARGVENE